MYSALLYTLLLYILVPQENNLQIKVIMIQRSFQLGRYHQILLLFLLLETFDNYFFVSQVDQSFLEYFLILRNLTFLYGLQIFVFCKPLLHPNFYNFKRTLNFKKSKRCQFIILLNKFLYVNYFFAIIM